MNFCWKHHRLNCVSRQNTVGQRLQLWFCFWAFCAMLWVAWSQFKQGQCEILGSSQGNALMAGEWQSREGLAGPWARSDCVSDTEEYSVQLCQREGFVFSVWECKAHTVNNIGNRWWGGLVNWFVIVMYFILLFSSRTHSVLQTKSECQVFLMSSSENIADVFLNSFSSASVLRPLQWRCSWSGCLKDVNSLDQSSSRSFGSWACPISKAVRSAWCPPNFEFPAVKTWQQWIKPTSFLLIWSSLDSGYAFSCYFQKEV